MRQVTKLNLAGLTNKNPRQTAGSNLSLFVTPRLAPDPQEGGLQFVAEVLQVRKGTGLLDPPPVPECSDEAVGQKELQHHGDEHGQQGGPARLIVRLDALSISNDTIGQRMGPHQRQGNRRSFV